MADSSGEISVKVVPNARGFSADLRRQIAGSDDDITIDVRINEKGFRSDFRKFSGDLADDSGAAGRQAGERLGKGMGDGFRSKGSSPLEKAASDSGKKVGQTFGDQGLLSINQRVKLWSGVITAAAPVAAAGLAAGFAVGFIGIAAAASSTSSDVKASFNSLKSTGLQEMRTLGAGTSDIFVRQLGIVEDGISGMGGQISRSVNIAGDGIDNLTKGIVDLAQNAMPGMLSLVENSGPVFSGMRDFLADTGTAVSDLGFDLSAVSGDIGQDFQHLGGIVTSTFDLAGAGLAGAASGFANHGYQIEAAVSGISSTVQQFATGAAPLLGGGLGLALNAVSGFTSALGPVAPAVGAAVTAFQGFRVVRGMSGMFSKAGGSLTNFSAKAGTSGTKMGKFAGILGGVASFAAGPLGIALGVAGLAFAAFGARQAAAAERAADVARRQRDIADTLNQTTGAVTANTRSVVEQQLAQSGAGKTARAYGLTMGEVVKGVTGTREQYDNITRSIDKFKPSMQELNEVTGHGIDVIGGLDQGLRVLAKTQAFGQLKGQIAAQRKAIEEFGNTTSQGLGLTTFALSQYQGAMNKFNDTSASAQDRAGALAVAMNTLSHSGITTTQAVAGLGDAFRDMRNSDFSDVVVDAKGRFDAMSVSGGNLSERMGAVQQSFLQVGTAMQESGASATQIRSRLDGMRQGFIRSAKAAGLTGQEAKRLADRWGLVPDKVATQIAISGLPKFNQAVETMRGHIDEVVEKDHKVILDADAADAATVLDGLGYDIRQMTDGRYEVNAKPGEGWDYIKDLIDGVKNSKPVVDVRADTKKAWKSFGEFSADVASTVGTSKLDANPKPANSKLTFWERAAKGTTGTPRLDANPAQANQKVAGWLTRATRTTGRGRFDANPGWANSAVSGWLGRARGARGTGQFNANAGGAWAAFNGWFSRANGATATAYLHVVRTGASLVGGAGAIGGWHDGGIVKQFASGGMHRKLTPMAAGLAQVVPPNTWRVVGDRAKDDESYIPINRSARSISLLMETARRMGFDLLKAYASGGINGPSQSGPQPLGGTAPVINNTITVRDNEDARVAAETLSANVGFQLRTP